MKNLLVLICLLLGINSLTAQKIQGIWSGTLKIQETQLRINIHVDGNSESGYSAKFDSPDQGAFGIPFSVVSFENNKLACSDKAMGIAYEAELEHDELKGVWMQGGMSLPLNLVRGTEPTLPNRPQEPTGDLPYKSKDVEVINAKAGVTLSATLTIPAGDGPFPAVILVSGSGPQDRNSEVFGHKPFLVLSDYLTRNGIAVLRYDDRGVGQSTGDFGTATSLDFAQDAEAAFNFLKSQPTINPKKTGIIGHSEGGMIAPMVAATNKEIGYVVLIAGPAVSIDELLIAQTTAIAKSNGASDDEIAPVVDFNNSFYQYVQNQTSVDSSLNNLEDFLAKNSPKNSDGETEPIDEMKKYLTPMLTPWFQYFISYNPQENLSKMKCPVLAIYGSLDLQVPSTLNINVLEPIFQKSKIKHTIIELKNHNHIMQVASTGSVNEYVQIEQTFSPEALETISNWIFNLKK
jgi:pimeloyl-ACP methyl ester carboxylesterase